MVNLQPSGHISFDVTPAASGSSALSSQDFSQKLSEAFSETLQKLGIDPSSIKMEIQSTSGQTPVTGQNPATLGFNGLVQRNLPQTPVTAPVTTLASTPASTPTSTQHWYASDPVDDAYWSKQPAAVQQLREIDNRDQREAMGRQLASDGYNIDVPIMLWGWDAGKTTAMRQDMGYTWVPSAMQNPVSAAPGLTGPGITPYDPKHPPAGSIQV